MTYVLSFLSVKFLYVCIYQKWLTKQRRCLLCPYVRLFVHFLFIFGAVYGQFFPCFYYASICKTNNHLANQMKDGGVQYGFYWSAIPPLTLEGCKKDILREKHFNLIFPFWLRNIWVMLVNIWCLYDLYFFQSCSKHMQQSWFIWSSYTCIFQCNFKEENDFPIIWICV